MAFRVQLPDSVVVTASRAASAAQKTGRRVTIYTQNDIQKLPVNSLDQLHDVVSGLDVQSRGGFGVQSDLLMQGPTFNGVLLFDGARINDPHTGQFLMDLPVPLSEIARVEVLHGPATALFGPDTFGGIVHLITKTGLRNGRMNDTGLSAAAEGRYGTNNLYDPGGLPPHRRLQHNSERSGFGAGQRLPNRVGDREFGAFHYYTNFPGDRAREATSTFWVQNRLASSGDTDTPWQVQLYGKQHRDRYTYNSTTGSNRHVSRRARVQGQVSHRLGDVHATSGASGDLRGVDSNRDRVHSDLSAGAFLSLRWRATSRFAVNQSTRVDYDPVYGVEPAWRCA